MAIEVYLLDSSPNRSIVLIKDTSDTKFYPGNATLISGINITSGTGTSVGPDLTAIEALTGTNTIYYRSAPDTWSPVIIGSGIGFSGGILTSSGSISGSYQPLDSDLTALAATTGNNTLYYRASNGVWSPVTFANNIIFSGGMISGSGFIGATGATGATGAQGIPGTGINYLSGIITKLTNVIIPKFDLTRPFPHNTAPGHGVPTGTVNYPAGNFIGMDDKNTVLVFPRQTGYLVSTEEFGQNTLSYNLYFGSGNSCQSPVIKNFTIDGSGNINVQSKIYNSGDPYLATGLAIEARSPQISNTSFFDIRGPALYVDVPHQSSGDDLFNNYWAGDMAFIKDVYIVGGFAGAVIKSTDTKIQNFYSVNVRDIGLDIYGASCFVNNSHIYGATTGVAVRQAGMVANNCYWEEAYICLDLLVNGYNCLISNVFTGPNGGYNRGIRIGSAGNTFKSINVAVRQEDANYPDIAGVEYTSNSLYNNSFDGSFSLNGAGSTSDCYILRGKQSYHTLRGGWNNPSSGNCVIVPSAIEGNEVKIKGFGKGGCILNLSGSALNITSGYGNSFDITWERNDLVGASAVTGIVYPNGGLAWNLEEGTTIKFNGKQLPQPKDNLFGYYRLNEATGNGIDAYLGNNLIQHNGIVNSSGLIYPIARTFNGSTQYFDASSSTFGAIGPKEVFSSIIWINLASKANYMAIMTKDDVGSNREYNVYYDVGNDTFTLELYNGGGSPTITLRTTNFGSPVINTWYMLYWEYNGSSVKINVNNGPFNSVSFTSTPFSGGSTFNLGRWSNSSNYYSGSMGPLRLYKRTLTDAERTTFYDNGYGFK